MEIFFQFLDTTGFAQMSVGNFLMIIIGIIFISLAILKDYEPLLLVPIGFGRHRRQHPIRSKHAVERL